MTDATLMKLRDLPIVKRGDGVETTLLVGSDRCGAVKFTSGLTRFPAGKKVPFHHHNCDEQVTLLEGVAEVEIEAEAGFLADQVVHESLEFRAVVRVDLTGDDDFSGVVPHCFPG